MPREERKWNNRFLAYMDMIANHPNYQGLPLDKKSDGSYRWIAPAKSETGKKRIDWCYERAEELGFIIQPGVFADVMLEIHPTKWKVCQTCGRKMSLYYHYPNATFLKALNRTFNTKFSDCDHIADIWDEICTNDYNTKAFAAFLIQKGGLDLDPYSATKDDIIDALEFACRKGGKKCLGPGAMSNFPDRYDGFHTYNRCCRSSQDKGRSKENLKSYTKDRRAYEYWSDGNIHAANQFMGSSFFKGTSADHIGPISLGFIHDPRYLQPMPSSDNSSKRDRLQLIDIEKIIETEARTKVYPMSWQSKHIWEFIRNNYQSHNELISGLYRDALKQNMSNYMYILRYILENCHNGEDFLIEAFLKQNYHYFEYSYEFNELGEIIGQTPRHFTGRNEDEISRYTRIAIEAVFDYTDKDNRNNKDDLSNAEIATLDKICDLINKNPNIEIGKDAIVSFVESIERRIIASIS